MIVKCPIKSLPVGLRNIAHRKYVWLDVVAPGTMVEVRGRHWPDTRTDANERTPPMRWYLFVGNRQAQPAEVNRVGRLVTPARRQILVLIGGLARMAPRVIVREDDVPTFAALSAGPCVVRKDDWPAILNAPAFKADVEVNFAQCWQDWCMEAEQPLLWQRIKSLFLSHMQVAGI